MELLATTLNQAHALFYTLPEGQLPDPSLPCGLLFSTLETITGQHPTGELLASLSHFLVIYLLSTERLLSACCGAELWGYGSAWDQCGPHLRGGHSLAVEADTELTNIHTSVGYPHWPLS